MSEKILAVSAGHEITEQELNNLIANYPPEQQIYMSSPDAKDQVLEQLIGYHLFAKMAVEEKITESKEYQDMLLKLQVELASHMAASSVIEGVDVTEEDAKEYYDNNADSFKSGAQVKAKHILVDEEENAKNIAKEISEGKTFEDAAKEYSSCPSKDRGGDLGFFGKGQMVPEFEKAAFEGEMNKVLGPVKTQFGYHLILVDEKKEEAVISYEEVKDKLIGQLLQEKKQNVYAQKVVELEKKYGVERKLGA